MKQLFVDFGVLVATTLVALLVITGIALVTGQATAFSRAETAEPLTGFSPMTVRLHLAPEPCPSSPSACYARPITLTIITGSSVYTYPLKTDNKGDAVQVTPVESLTFRWRVESWQALAVRAEDTVAPDFPIGFGPILGDVNGDNLVASQDFVILRNNFGLPVPPADPAADLNHDNIVNSVDASILYANFATAGDPPWPNP